MIRVIGKGAFGKVIMVEKKNDGKVFAMKTLRKEVVKQRNQIVHTKAERSILEKVGSPFIVNLK